MIKNNSSFFCYKILNRLPKLFILNCLARTDRHNPSPLEMEFGVLSKLQFFLIVGQLLCGQSLHFNAIIKKGKAPSFN